MRTERGQVARRRPSGSGWRSPRLWKALGPLAALLLAAPGAQAQTTWTGELLTNPGFESGTTGWTNGGGGTMVAGAACSIYCNDPPHGGVNQAYWTTSNSPTTPTRT